VWKVCAICVVQKEAGGHEEGWTLAEPLLVAYNSLLRNKLASQFTRVKVPQLTWQSKNAP
jgi:hypothetical protein